MFRVNAAVVSHAGRVRDNNEDNYCFFRSVFNNVKDNSKIKHHKQNMKRIGCVGIFDGMGGFSLGDAASSIAVEAMSEVLNSDGEMLQNLKHFCDVANNRICSEMLKLKKRMGSTASILCLKNDRYYLCNLGDSPVFRLRGNTLEQISLAHIEKIDVHKKTEKKKPRLTQYLGIFPDETELKPYITTGRCKIGDKFLLCSDGLTDMVPLKDIRKILGSSMPVRRITQELLEKALENGGIDNITIICAEIIKSSVIDRIFG